MKAISENIKSILALMIMFLGIVYIFAITFLETENSDNQGIIAITALMSGISGYYYGYSSGSAKKDDTINDLTKKQ